VRPPPLVDRLQSGGAVVIVLCTDFGLSGPYVGQVKTVLARIAPAVPVIDLFADLPAFAPKLSAYLLAAYAGWFEAGDVIVAVVDPGVGGARAALVVETDGKWFVGPDNGLFELVLRRAREARCFAIAWRPAALSATFHGRDLFAPVAARLALDEPPPGPATTPLRYPDWPDDLAEIVYVDHFGNAMTGLRATGLAPATELEVAGRRLRHGRTFGDVPAGEPLWYENANGLAEVGVNGGNAAAYFGLIPGSPVRVRRLP
jgi:S-adenosylmethionine hydrolase